MAFIERGYPTGLLPNRDVGIQVHGELGEVVVVDLEDAMRDPALFEVGWSGPPMMMDE